MKDYKILSICKTITVITFLAVSLTATAKEILKYDNPHMPECVLNLPGCAKPVEPPPGWTYLPECIDHKCLAGVGADVTLGIREEGLQSLIRYMSFEIDGWNRSIEITDLDFIKANTDWGDEKVFGKIQAQTIDPSIILYIQGCLKFDVTSENNLSYAMRGKGDTSASFLNDDYDCNAVWTDDDFCDGSFNFCVNEEVSLDSFLMTDLPDMVLGSCPNLEWVKLDTDEGVDNEPEWMIFSVEYDDNYYTHHEIIIYN